MERNQDSAFKRIMTRREDLLRMADDLDRHLEERIKEMRERNINIHKIVLGKKLYIILLESCILRKLEAINGLRVKGGFVDRIFPELHTRLSTDAIMKRNGLFERVGKERFPIHMDLKSPPNSVNVVTC